MTEYIAFESQVEVIGAAIMSVSSGLGETVIPTLKKYNLYPLEANNWYKQQDWLDAFHEISSRGRLSLLAIGMTIPDKAVWPPNVKTVHEALASIDLAYHMNHRNGEIGCYKYERTGDFHGIMVCQNPYPSDFDLGVIYGTVRKFCSNTKSVSVQLDNKKPSRKTGDETCTFLISWSD